MRKVTKIEDITECDFRNFEITLEDGSTFNFDLLLDNGEWVLDVKGDEERGVRLCQSEMESILEVIKKLNERQRWK